VRYQNFNTCTIILDKNPSGNALYMIYCNIKQTLSGILNHKITQKMQMIKMNGMINK
jgi:hypothetical protein